TRTLRGACIGIKSTIHRQIRSGATTAHRIAASAHISRIQSWASEYENSGGWLARGRQAATPLGHRKGQTHGLTPADLQPVVGGFGSGRPSGSGRTTVGACRSIDVNRLHKTGCLRPGWSGGWQWTCDGEQIAWIKLRTDDDRL